MRGDITSHNEYVRGSTLRTLCKILCWNVIEPLVADIYENLKHRHAYVRRNAVMCVYSLHENFGLDVTDAIEEMESLISVSSDTQTKRNALLFLGAVAPDKAIEYVLQLAQEREASEETTHENAVDIVEVEESTLVSTDTTQLAVLSLCRRAVALHPELRSSLLREVFALAEDELHPSVAFEGCNALMTLTANRQAVNTAVKVYLRLLNTQSDNNIRLLVLDRLAALVVTQSAVIESHLEDLLRVLEVPHIAIRKKVLEISLKVLSRNSVSTFVTVLRKHLIDTTKSNDILAKQDENNVEFRRILARCMHLACSMHPDAATSVVHVLLDLFAETDAATSSEVILMIRELACRAPQLRTAILSRIVTGFNEMYQSVVIRVALWLLGEFTSIESEQGSPSGDEKVVETLQAIISAAGTAPFLPTQGERGNNCNVDIREEKVVIESPNNVAANPDAPPPNKGITPSTPLRKFIQLGDWLVSAVTCQTIASLMVRATSSPKAIPTSLRQEAILVVANIAKFARDDSTAGPHSDAATRATQALRAILADVQAGDAGSSVERQRFAEHAASARTCLMEVIEAQAESSTDEFDEAVRMKMMSADSSLGSTKNLMSGGTILKSSAAKPITFRQLQQHADTSHQGAVDEKTAGTLSLLGSRTAGSQLGGGADKAGAAFLKKLTKVQQMSGCADPVYVEAVLNIEEYSGTVELFVVNRTSETLTNVTIELLTSSTDLRIVDRPSAFSLGPFASKTVTASLHISSTEAGSLFGYLTLTLREGANSGPFLAKKTNSEDASPTSQVIPLDKIHIDLLDMLRRNWSTESAFRQMWLDFEWENRIEVGSESCDVKAYVLHLLEHTNLTVVRHGETAVAFNQMFKNFGGVSRGRSFSSTSPSSPASMKGNRSGSNVGVSSLEELETKAYIAHVSTLPEMQRLKPDTSFFSVNLYGKSIFAEDVLANLSIRREGNGLEGTVRIRARSRGIAISLGDRISYINKNA